jgi:hypothetical protein
MGTELEAIFQDAHHVHQNNILILSPFLFFFFFHRPARGSFEVQRDRHWPYLFSFYFGS